MSPDVLAVPVACIGKVRAAFEQYEKALVSNDVEMLDAMFHDDPRTIAGCSGFRPVCPSA